MSSDADQLQRERVQKLHAVMDHLGFQEEQQRQGGGGAAFAHPDPHSLLSARDAQRMRASYVDRPPDSYIFAAVRWLAQSVRASFLKFYEPPALTYADLVAERRHDLDAQRHQHQQQQQEEEAPPPTNQGPAELGASSEGRELKLSLTADDAKNLHPKMAEARAGVLELEKNTHDTLDRLMRARVKFLALPEEEPPCSQDMRVVADCYAQFAARKFEASEYIETHGQAPPIMKRQFEADVKSGKFQLDDDGGRAGGRRCCFFRCELAGQEKKEVDALHVPERVGDAPVAERGAEAVE